MTSNCHHQTHRPVLPWSTPLRVVDQWRWRLAHTKALLFVYRSRKYRIYAERLRLALQALPHVILINDVDQYYMQKDR